MRLRLRLKRLLIGLIASLPLVFLIPSEASALVCVNAVNASVLGATNQTNTCPTNLTAPTP